MGLCRAARCHQDPELTEWIGVDFDRDAVDPE